jgi:site-specific recombinase XerD
MTIELHSKFNYREICHELGISIDDLMSLINNKPISNEENSEITVLEAIGHFEKNLSVQLKLGKKSSSTIRVYRYFLNRLKEFIKQRNENMMLSQLNENELEHFFLLRDGRKGQSLSRQTQNNNISIVRKMMSIAYELDLTNRNYSKKFKWHKSDLLPRYLQDDQLEYVYREALQKVHGYRCHAIIAFLVGTGCRISELVDLKVQDFDIENNIIFIKKGKGDKGRFITMFPMVKKVILDYLDITGIKEWDSDIDGYLFSRDYGYQRTRKISQRSIQSMVQSIYKRLNYTGLTVHSFRHTFAVHCIKQGMNFIYLGQLLGHKHPETTYIYVQMFPNDLQNELAKKFPFAFDKLISQVLRYDEHE